MLWQQKGWSPPPWSPPPKIYIQREQRGTQIEEKRKESCTWCQAGDRNPTAEKFHKDYSHKEETIPEQQLVSGKEAEHEEEMFCASSGGTGDGGLATILTISARAVTWNSLGARTWPRWRCCAWLSALHWPRVSRAGWRPREPAARAPTRQAGTLRSLEASRSTSMEARRRRRSRHTPARTFRRAGVEGVPTRRPGSPNRVRAPRGQSPWVTWCLYCLGMQSSSQLPQGKPPTTLFGGRHPKPVLGCKLPGRPEIRAHPEDASPPPPRPVAPELAAGCQDIPVSPEPRPLPETYPSCPAQQTYREPPPSEPMGMLEPHRGVAPQLWGQCTGPQLPAQWRKPS